MARNDGRPIKSAKPFVKLVPYIMDRRSDSQIFVKEIVCTEKIDAYLHEKHNQDFKLTYMQLFIAVYVRVIAERPQLNRFVMNNRLYSRNGIHISMVVKPSLNDETQETTVKFAFTGRENIFEIVSIINKKISGISESESQAEMDKIASGILALPGPLKNMLVAVLKSMDRHNILPESIVEASPFHTSLFFSYLKSIKMDYVYHHLYDFGTTGIFAALGKVKKMPVVEEDKVVIKNCCEIGYTFDERICDGLYLVNSLKHAQKYLDEPQLLETGLEEITEDII
ncbi:MAG: 2-oxo acid dehydrogenase subunit E2 [Clostridiaceae bacterium]